MKQSKKWYDYLWIFFSYISNFGIFNILFAWLGASLFFYTAAYSGHKRQ